MTAAFLPIFKCVFLLLLITYAIGVDLWAYDKGPNSRQTKQYVSRPYSSLEEECTNTRVIVEHCHKDEEGGDQYTECDYKTNFWEPVLRVVKCIYPLDKCREGYSKQRKTTARCVDGSTRPSFPKTGSISWKVDYTYEPEEEGRTKEAQIFGKVWKDDKGNFYRKEQEIHRWPQRYPDNDDGSPPNIRTNFLILRADGNGKFTMYKGNDAGHCEKSQFTGQRKLGWKEQADDLTSAWFSYHGQGLNDYRIRSRKKLAGDLYQQVWVEIIDFDLWESNMKWTMNYNVSARHAIPLRAEWDHNEWGPHGGRHYWKYNFRYQTLDDDDRKMDVPDFCPASE